MSTYINHTLIIYSLNYSSNNGRILFEVKIVYKVDSVHILKVRVPA